jgi:hypothetical protein
MTTPDIVILLLVTILILWFLFPVQRNKLLGVTETPSTGTVEGVYPTAFDPVNELVSWGSTMGSFDESRLEPQYIDGTPPSQYDALPNILHGEAGWETRYD